MVTDNWSLATIHIKRHHPGFTLIEIILIMTIFTILTTLASINLIKPQSSSKIDTTAATLIADIKEQQIKSISGDTEGASFPTQFGIYLEPSSYTLFQGTTYLVSDPNNFEVDLETGILISNNLPSSQLSFSINSGEWENFSSSQNSITIQDSTSNQKIITINRYGAFEVN